MLLLARVTAIDAIVPIPGVAWNQKFYNIKHYLIGQKSFTVGMDPEDIKVCLVSTKLTISTGGYHAHTCSA